MTESTDSTQKWGKDVVFTIEDGIAWIKLNRPEKRNAINPGIVFEMNAVLDELEMNDACQVVVISGNGDTFSAGQDLKEYFREPASWHPVERERMMKANAAWQWRRLMYYPKPTIAMVNGWCFGGAFQVLLGCDLAIADVDARFGLSEINWGIIPAGIVTKSVAMALTQRKALYYIMTGENFDGREAENIGLVNFAVPADQLVERTKKLAAVLMEKNPHVLRACKVGYHYVRDMQWDMAAEYLSAKSDQAKFLDPEKGAAKGMSQFIDEKSYRPGLGAYDRKR
ncbi:p-hydroxycinnamoyl CoA hydratase/lyase [Roseiarcaceae bacterium H3SJ34-1]|uniref:p-hydroxycinnamoyl CoA hydratase/lyase n=1 Tax=Terripilifer ovatus TaxID=3032367 RepID=UPI003AB9766C|nr:p-hydroxycinnamoyl CoA hydratase/lyase [Roseiarcaceae bacterium H3SJ34-1]